MAFANYTQLPHLAPRPVWIAARVVVLAATVALVVWLASGDPRALTVAWSLCIPALPALWALAPGIWRNLCPMAFLNQIPRELGFSRANARPQVLRTWAYAISLVLLLGGIVARILVLNHSGVASAALFGTALVLAFAGGLVFKGKSGWCGTFCPLAPVQKLYGQLPVAIVRNEYCSPCVGCQTHCYDFNPTAALPSDLYDRDQASAEQRRFFAGMYPGFILGYFTFAQFGWVGLVGFPLVSLGALETIRAFTRTTAYLLVVAWGLLAIATYYLFATPLVLRALGSLFHLHAPPQTATVVEIVVAAGAVALLAASVRHEQAYRTAVEDTNVAKLPDRGEELRATIAASGAPQVAERSSGRSFLVQAPQVLLEAIEQAGIRIESGCRMGMCGADPVLIVEGAQNIAPPGAEEKSTLTRLGLGANCRMACSAHCTGNVTIDVDPKAVAAEGRADTAPLPAAAEQPTIRVVVVGNGAAGMSVAEHVRRRDPHASITVVSEEPYHLYNRMGVGRLIYGRSAMQGLNLLEETWYEQQRIDVWLNTRAQAIHRDTREVELATGETIPYDVLVIATGANAMRPPTPGIDRNGSFVLRTADDALVLRHWIQMHHAKRGVVIGGGVLGVEAADALRQLGIAATIVARGKHLMDRQLDDQAGAILQGFLEGMGITVLTRAQVAEITGDPRVDGVNLADGTHVETDLVLSCIGIVPNADLAREAGLEVRRGVVVDASMRTSDPSIYAVGDVAELAGATGGLWPVGKKQGEIAAAAICGDAAAYEENRTMLHVKLSGIDVKCFGEVEIDDDACRTITGSSSPGQCWRKVVVKDDRVVGGVFVGETEIAKQVATALADPGELRAVVQRLENGAG